MRASAREASLANALDAGAPASGGGTVVLGRYLLLARLGAGGFGVVWRAHDQLLNREVAVKAISMPSGEDRDRATREALASARLAHPAIVALYEACAEGDTFYLISELVHGDTLARLIAADALGDEEIAQIGTALADALAHAHGRGVIHRDIKPQNVLVPASDEHVVAAPWPVSPPSGAIAKLTDFGGALLAGEEPLTRTGDVLGTLAYMAPEQIDGGEVTEAADLYALALVLYEAFSGVNPVRGATPAATARRIGERLAPLERHRRDLPHELTRALNRALDPDPARRGTLPELYGALAWEAPNHPAALDRRWHSQPPSSTAWQEHDAAAPPAAHSDAEPASKEQPRAGRWLTPQRLAWLAAAVAACVWQLATDRAIFALLVLWAVLPLVVLVRRPGPRWLAAALAAPLGLAGLADAFPALAGQADGWQVRALLGALGYWWLRLAELPRGGATPTLHAVLSLPGAAVLAGAAVWAAAAAVLPWLVRGRSAPLDVLAAATWAGALAATPLLARGLPAAHGALPSLRAAIPAVALGAALAVVARALRGPVQAIGSDGR